MFNNGFELSIEVNGRSIPEFGHKGKTYVEGRKHYPYKIKFRNSRAERVLVVPTVDGLSVVDGNPHNALTTGYVVQAYSSLTISGWRTSLSEVRDFQFNEKSGSYAGKTAGQQNCGIIGAQVFAELKKVPTYDVHVHYHPVWPAPVVVHPPPQPSFTYPGIWTGTMSKSVDSDSLGARLMSYSAGAEGSAGPTGPAGVQGIPGPAMSCSNSQEMSVMYCAPASSAPDFNLGTTYGQARHDAVTQVNFERGICLATFEIYYSDREGLLKDGIQVDKTPELAHFPKAFGGFCQLP